MNRRRIAIDVVTSGNPVRSVAKLLKLDLASNNDQKIIWYTSSKKKAEESLVPAAKNAMDSLGICGKAVACTGGASLPMKALLLTAFRGEA